MAITCRVALWTILRRAPAHIGLSPSLVLSPICSRSGGEFLIGEDLILLTRLNKTLAYRLLPTVNLDSARFIREGWRILLPVVFLLQLQNNENLSRCFLTSVLDILFETAQMQMA